MLDDFAVFILTHGRADNIVTYKTLQRAGYTGRVYIVIDNEDKQADKYYQNFGDKVIMFDKAAIAETFDEGDNFQDRRAVIYARNACFDIAEKLGIEYFMQLDDDYGQIKFRINHKLEHPKDHYTFRGSFDFVVKATLDYYKSIPVLSIAYLQGGDFFAGGKSFGKAKRKCMNTFFCSTKRRFYFVGRINEDVNTYTSFQNKGNVFFSIPFIQVDQNQTQNNSGGMSEMYLDSGTYIKSFYTVMYQPSSVRVGLMGDAHQRLHHSINWDCTVPCIIPESYRKDGAPV